MALSRLATLIGGALLSKSGRRFAGRHAGKLALATLAWELYQQHKRRGAPQAAQTQKTQAQKTTPHPRQRWSGRRA